MRVHIMLGLMLLTACANGPEVQKKEPSASDAQFPKFAGDIIKKGRLDISLCTDDSCGEKEVSAYFRDEKPYVSSDLGETRAVSVPVDFSFYASLWSRLEKLKFAPYQSNRSTAGANELEGVPGCKASFHVRIQMPTQGWYTNICRNRDDAATVLSYLVRDVEYIVLRHRSVGAGVR